MEPYFFGDAESALFGVYHPPSGKVARDYGVLLCPPIAQEYVRAHWSQRQLATNLARAGLHVFRFDYFGIGDSAGHATEASVARWRSDIKTAAAELRDASGVKRIAVVGLRLGAALALGALADGLRAREIVLWDPVVSGAEYMREIESLHDKMVVDPKRFAFSLTRDLALMVPRRFRTGRWDGKDDELLGFPFTSKLCSEIAALEPLSFIPTIAENLKRVVIVASKDRPAYARLQSALERAGATVERRAVSDGGGWDDVAAIESALLPGETLRAIGDALSGGPS